MTRALRTQLKKLLFACLILGSAYLVQTGIFPMIPYFPSCPNLLLILTVCVGFLYGCEAGMLYGFIAGLLMDLSGGGLFGFYMLIYVVIGYFNGIFNRFCYEDVISLPMLLSVLSVLLYHLYIYALRFFVRGKLDIAYYFLHIVLKDVLMTLVLSLLFYRLAATFSDRFRMDETRNG